MKKLLLRLRHWLIKKLGGYTEQTILPMVRYPPSVMLHPERVCAQARVSYEMLRGDREGYEYFARMAKSDLVYKMVEEIIARDFGVLTCEPDWQHGIEESVYTMMLCIVPPNEWMKTTLGDCMTPRPVYGRMDHDVIRQRK